MLFPFADYWWIYLAFGALVSALLAVDLTLNRKAHVISFREAALWTAVWIALALCFNYGLYLFASSRLPPDAARQLSLEFLAGYVVEESLSIDNMFVFALIFRHFAIPAQYQHKVLFYGVLGAMVFRAIFVGIGSALVRFEWVLILFGLFLIVTGIRMAWERETQHRPGQECAAALGRTVVSGHARFPRAAVSSSVSMASAMRPRCSWCCCCSKPRT